MTEKVLETEVVVVGGGPAGVSAAFTLGRQKIPTILVDRKPKEKIGDKVCGDALNPILTKWCYDQVGLPQPDPEKKELMEIAETIVLRGSNPRVILPMGLGSATVDRLRYGQKLLHAAEELESVSVMAETRVKEVIVENNVVKGVKVLTPEGEQSIMSKIVIDASGSSGVVRRRLPLSMCTKFPQKIPREEMIVAYREIIRTKEPHQFQKGLYLTYEKELEEVMPGYYWFFSRGERELNIGLGYLMIEENLGKNIRELNQSVRDRYFPDAEILASQGDQIPARMPLPSLVHNGFITAGDAGALANPLNGEGHGPALFSGIKAAQEILKVREEGKEYTEEHLWGYNKWVWSYFGVEFAMGIGIIKFIFKFGYPEFEWLIEHGIITEDDINTQLYEPAKGHKGMLKKVFKLARKPRVLMGLRKTLNHVEKLVKIAQEYPDIENFDEWNRKLEKELETEL